MQTLSLGRGPIEVGETCVYKNGKRFFLELVKEINQDGTLGVLCIREITESIAMDLIHRRNLRLLK